MIRILTVLSTFLFSSVAFAYSVTKIAEFDGTPWAIEFVDDNTLIVNIKSGEIYALDIEKNKSSQLNEVDVYSSGQGGLLDVAVSPKSSSTLYFTYSKNLKGGATVALASAEYKSGTLSNWRDIFVADAQSSTSRHFGSRITFDDEGHLYFSIGDRGDRDNGQDTSNHAASILRLNIDGSVPNTNPFTKTESVRDEVWSFGHRNPQGLFFDSKTQQLWSIEHGPRGGDEINLIKPELNYGWPITSHGKEYWGPISVGEAKEMEGIENPSLVYVPSIAPASLVLYRGNKYDELNGKLIAGALKLTHLNVVSIDSSGELREEKRLLESLGERIRDITISPNDYLYFSTDSGNIYRLEPH